MVYDWGGYRDGCYQMYITEKKPLEEIMEYMKTVHNFAPSKRAFQTQFKRWGFPSKQNPAHKNVDLVQRVKELWEKNTSQRDMLQTLNNEGFEIKERELMRVRAKNRWLLRVPNGMKAHGYTEALIDEAPPEDSELLALQQELNSYNDADPDNAIMQPTTGRGLSPPLDPEVVRKRKERFDKLQAESDARYAARKRRRRTRGWAGLPADPPAPPRFPSETTIDESKRYLELDNTRYRELREQFQVICEDVGIIKKTLAGDDQWKAAKNRLIEESPHLVQVFYGNDKTGTEQKHLALDVICTDVTKRMRTLERRMTIAEAKNALGVNPEQSRQIRNSFYNTLKADHFTSKLEAGEDHWKELKEQWIQDTPLLQSLLAPGDNDPQHQTKVKAMEVLCRDVMKRLRDDQTKRDPNRKAQPGMDGESPQQLDAQPIMSPPPIPRQSTKSKSRVAAVQQATFDNMALASKALARTEIPDSTISDFQIDPSLLQAASDPTSFMSHDVSAYLPATHHGQLDPSDVFQPQSPPQPANLTSTPLYIRPHPASTATLRPNQTKMWLAKLSTRSEMELRSIVQIKYPGLSINRIEGIEKGSDAGAGEVSYLIDGDEVLDAYLTHVEGGKAVFVVHLS